MMFILNIYFNLENILKLNFNSKLNINKDYKILI